jgi:hypothetical protein
VTWELIDCVAKRVVQKIVPASRMNAGGHRARIPLSFDAIDTTCTNIMGIHRNEQTLVRFFQGINYENHQFQLE